MVGEGAQSLQFFMRIGDQPSFPQHHHGSIVHGMVKSGTCQHQRIHQCDRDTDVNPSVERAQHPAGG